MNKGHNLAPFLFILHCTPLSIIISSLSLNHQLFAHDTKLLFCFILLFSTQVSFDFITLFNGYLLG